MYDHFGFYAPAFMTGILSNLVNLVLLGSLVWRARRTRYRSVFA
jgi:hypothetical protein